VQEHEGVVVLKTFVFMAVSVYPNLSTLSGSLFLAFSYY
jgi:hypothetical protein